jgi:hypothetical protein
MITSPKFELAISFVLILNMGLIAAEYYNQSSTYSNVVYVLNEIFVTIYGLESLFKLIGLTGHFFRNPWNIFDLMINFLSILCMFILNSIHLTLKSNSIV